MKFQQLLALQKHLESSFLLGQVPRSFLIAHGEKEERKRLLSKMAHLLGDKTKGTISFYSVEEWGKAYEALISPSLFGETEVILVDGVKNMEEGMEKSVLAYIAKPSPHAFFLLGIEPSKGLPLFYDKAKKDLVFLDMAEEKPWDKEKRLQQEMLMKVREEGKTITPGALRLLMQTGGQDALTLESELLKILCYIGDKKAILEGDIAAIATPAIEDGSWQQAESLVWEGRFSYHQPDLSFLIAFIGQVRFLLQQARQFLWCQEQRKETQEIGKLLNIKPFLLQKLQDRVRRYPVVYFEKALDLVYEVELKSKSSFMSASFLLDLLQIKVTDLKRTYVK